MEPIDEDDIPSGERSKTIGRLRFSVYKARGIGATLFWENLPYYGVLIMLSVELVLFSFEVELLGAELDGRE